MTEFSLNKFVGFLETHGLNQSERNKAVKEVENKNIDSLEAAETFAQSIFNFANDDSSSDNATDPIKSEKQIDTTKEIYNDDDYEVIDGYDLDAYKEAASAAGMSDSELEQKAREYDTNSDKVLDNAEKAALMNFFSKKEEKDTSPIETDDFAIDVQTQTSSGSFDAQ